MGQVGQTWVWKMSWAASTALVRIWPASCIDELRALDGHHDRGRVGGLAGGERLDAWAAASFCVAWPATAMESPSIAAEARAGGVAGGRRTASTGAICHSAPDDGEGRIDGHQRRISRVLENICLAADIAVTLAS